MPSAAAPMGIYERGHHPLAEAGAGGGGAGVWGDPFRYMASASGAAPGCGSSSSPAAAHAMELAEPKFEPPALHRTMLPQDVEALALQEAQLPHSPDSSDQEPARPGHKIQRRLAQNREAARKSRLRKKAYIENLETSRMKLAQMEQELTRARQQQMVYAGASGSSSSHVGLPPASSFDPGVAAFEIEYAQWVEEQTRQTRELRAALQQPDAPERRLSALAEAGLEHYDRLFLAKSAGARVLLLTAQPEGDFPRRQADAVAHLPAQTMADDQDEEDGAAPAQGSSQAKLPMGSLYEGAMFVLFEMVVLELARVLGQSPAQMRARHTNLE